MLTKGDAPFDKNGPADALDHRLGEVEGESWVLGDRAFEPFNLFVKVRKPSGYDRTSAVHCEIASDRAKDV
jgi:hypothetical protein